VGVDLDLAIEVPGYNPELGINFDLNINTICDCEAGTVTIMLTTSNLEAYVDFNWIQEDLLAGFFFIQRINLHEIEEKIEEEIEASFQQITESIVIDLGGLCLRVEVDDDVNVNFTF